MPGAGQFNSLVNILKGFDTDDENTGEPVTEYRPLHRKVPAMREDISGSSTRRGHQVEERVKVVFTVPYIPDFDTHWRVEKIGKHNENETFEVITVRDVDDKQIHLELQCSVIK